MIVTVTLNAAIDRTLTVPNFQLGQRHRASAGLTVAGGKGINVARALKRLGVPVVATGLAGGRTGTRIIEELTGEAILNDFVRIAGESRTSTAVVDPTGGTYTEINEWGPHVEAEELQMLLDKLHYLAGGAELVVVAGSLPRGVDDGFYSDLIRDLPRDQLPSLLDSAAEPLRLERRMPLLDPPHVLREERQLLELLERDQARTQTIVDVVVVVSDLVGEVRELRFEPRLAARDEAFADVAEAARFLERAVLQDPLARLEREVQPAEARIALLELVDHA